MTVGSYFRRLIPATVTEQHSPDWESAKWTGVGTLSGIEPEGARVKGTYYYLYMIIDMFSRKVVGWDVFAKEDGVLARVLFATTLASEGVRKGKR